MNSPTRDRNLLRSLALFVAVSLVGLLLWFGATKIWPYFFSGLSQSEPPNKGPVTPFVVLDAGHGGMDTGAAGQGLHEKDGTLEIIQRVAKQLDTHGIKVVLTRAKDVFIELDQRVVPTTWRGALAFVSVHLNATKAKTISGIETYFSSTRPCCDSAELKKKLSFDSSVDFEDHRSELLGEIIQKRVATATGSPDRGIRDSRLHVTRNASCPAVLVECGYLTNKDEALRLKRSDYKDKIATAIAEGVLEYLEKTSADPRSGLVIASPPPAAVTSAQP